MKFDHERNADGLQLTLRHGDASVCLGFAPETDRIVGAGVIEYARSKGAAVYAATPLGGLGVGAALRPVRWVDYATWRKNPDNIKNARVTSLWLTPEWIYWRYRAIPYERSPFSRNTRRDGYVTWARALLGKATSKYNTIATERVTVTLPEGEYGATAEILEEVSTRARLPWFPARTRGVRVTLDHDAPLPARMYGGVRNHSCDGENIGKALREFAASIQGRRGTWEPPLRLRRGTVTLTIDSTVKSITDGPPDPNAVVPWDALHYASGQWKPWGEARESELPKEARVDRPLTGGESVSTAMLLGMIGVCGLGAFMGYKAHEERR